MGYTSPIFRAYVCSATATLTLGIASLYAFGLAGAALGIIMNSLILNTVLWRHYRRAVNRDSEDSAAQKSVVGRP
jgi:hypothetical protein